MICKTDLKTAIRLLERSAELIDKNCKYSETDIARQNRKLIKKLKKKIEKWI